MPPSRAKKAAVAARREKLIALRLKRRPYREIYAELGYKSPYAASRDFNRALEENLVAVRTSVEVYREAELLELDDLAVIAHKVMDTIHYAHGSGGRVVCHPVTGDALVDDGPRLAAMDRLLRIQDRRAKLLGLDAATKFEVLTIDALDAEAARLNAELAALDSEAPTPAADQGTAG